MKKRDYLILLGALLIIFGLILIAYQETRLGAFTGSYYLTYSIRPYLPLGFILLLAGVGILLGSVIHYRKKPKRKIF